MIDGILFVINGMRVWIWKLKSSCLSNILQMNLTLSIKISKSTVIHKKPHNGKSKVSVFREIFASSEKNFISGGGISTWQ